MPTDRTVATFDPPDVAEMAAPADSGFRPAYCAEIDEAEIIRRYVPLVKRLALHLKGRLPEAVQLDDLIQAGLIAVLRIMRQGSASHLRDPPLHRSIMNAMIDEARREAWAPVRIVRLAKAASRAMSVLKQRLGRDADDDEVAAELGMPLAEYLGVLLDIAGIRLLQLDAFEGGEDRGLQVADEIDAGLDRAEMLAQLARAIAALPAREKLVVSLYYEQELNMDEVGKVLRLDKSTVCRAHGRALLILRSALGGLGTAGGMSPSAAGD
jgi:RNA polymerase sigma factor for flagellar operon FliA